MREVVGYGVISRLNRYTHFMLKLTKQQTKQLAATVAAPLRPQAGSLMARRSRSRTPTRRASRSTTPRSRSQSRVVHGPGFRAPFARKAIAHAGVRAIAPLVKKKSELGKQLTLIKNGYFAADSKDSKDTTGLQQQVDNLTKEIQLAVSAVKAGLGDRPIRLRLTAAFALTATVTSGVVNTVTIGGSATGRINPGQDSSEWSAVSSLFDEVKVLGGHITFTYTNSVPTTAATQVNNAGDPLPIIGYDVDSTSVVGSVAMAQLSQHKAIAPLVTGSGAATITSPTLHTFKYHIPRGTAVDLANSVIPGTEWQSVQQMDNVGYIKFYHVGVTTTAVTVGNGVHYYDVELRCRA